MPRKKQAPSDAHPSGRTLSDVTATTSMSASPAQRPDRAPIPIKQIEFVREVRAPGRPATVARLETQSKPGAEWVIEYIPAPHPWARHYRVTFTGRNGTEVRYYPAEWCSGVPV